MFILFAWFAALWMLSVRAVSVLLSTAVHFQVLRGFETFLFFELKDNLLFLYCARSRVFMRTVGCCCRYLLLVVLNVSVRLIFYLFIHGLCWLPSLGDYIDEFFFCCCQRGVVAIFWVPR